MLEPSEPLGDGVDDAGGHRVEGAGHGVDLGPPGRIGALQHVLAREIEVARPGRHERGEHGADLGRLHLAASSATARRSSDASSRIPGAAYAADGRQPGDDADGRDQCRVAGGDGEGVDGAGRPAEHGPAGDAEVVGEGGDVVGERADRAVGMR